MKLMLVSVLLLFSQVACDCGNSGKEQSGINQLPDRLVQWQGNQLSNYTIEYRESCFCPDRVSVEITVAENVITGIVEKDRNGEVVNTVAPIDYANYFTIEGFFEFISVQKDLVDKIAVEYDSALGYPAVINIDPQASSCSCGGGCSDVIDDEYSYAISVVING